MSEKNTTVLSWEAPEFRHYPKNFGWYVSFWAVVVLVVFYQIITKDYFGALSVVLIGLLGVLLLRQNPEQVTISLDHKGLYVDDLHVPYKNMQSFWVVDTETHRTLNIETTAYLNRLLIIELEGQDPDHVRSVLLPVVPEHEATTPTLVQRLMHIFKM